jgi:hypothetical protein
VWAASPTLIIETREDLIQYPIRMTKPPAKVPDKDFLH